MTALQVTNQIFFASSMKSKSGASFIYDEKTAVKDNMKNPNADGSIEDRVSGNIKTALGQAKTKGPGKKELNEQHKNDVPCDEVIFTYAWLLKHGGPQGKGLMHRKPEYGTHSNKVDQPNEAVRKVARRLHSLDYKRHADLSTYFERFFSFPNPDVSDRILEQHPRKNWPRGNSIMMPTR
ncbi:uncharacterized protein EURHEDRAFT_416524 [Aspergillus ruber CBS 135680]|uniref:Uncharacterized protein n=1 Tax=Aspergillus ruber (strain CBS 135680) TaxID=1388766 RepID=A0A017S2J9_ASPRC|nr:uncharacterized protein EURHEDRAFT_416524 [Aspergillus ruber CBS 135680]EYE91268.1 hypothetical protein EURHEDRAFT_416524 [Aspergillus ruber CBS 135680]